MRHFASVMLIKQTVRLLIFTSKAATGYKYLLGSGDLPMRLHKLTLQAFGPYLEKHTLDFTASGNGTAQLITGPGGTGKTTLFKAILYALFGLPGLNSFQDKHPAQIFPYHLRNIDAGLEAPTEITLDFKLNNKLYRVEGIINPEDYGFYCTDQDHLATLEILETDEYIALGDTEVTANMEELLQTTKEVYPHLVAISPGTKDSFITLDPALKRKWLKSLFKAGEIEVIWQEILKNSNHYLQEIKDGSFFFEIPTNLKGAKTEDLFSPAIYNQETGASLTLQAFSAGWLALLSISLQLGLLDTLQQYSHGAAASFLLLDKGFDQIDQQTTRQFLAGISKHNHYKRQLICTSTNPELKTLFPATVDL